MLLPGIARSLQQFPQVRQPSAARFQAGQRPGDTERRREPSLMTYLQHYDPLHQPILSTLVAALPVIILFYLLVVRRALAPWAAGGGALAALMIAILVYRMPAAMAGMAFISGALFGLLPICWTILNAMFLYNITVETGKFESIK